MAVTTALSFPMLNRNQLIFQPLAARKNKFDVSKMIRPDAVRKNMGEKGEAVMRETIDRIRAARESGKSRMLTFGAHTIKNGLSPVLIRLIEDGWITHLATNGAGIIHDWELAFHGETSEDVRENTSKGEFGASQETGFNINMAIIMGAYHGLGYGASIGAMVHNDGFEIPNRGVLLSEAQYLMESNPDKALSAINLLQKIKELGLKHDQFVSVPHQYKEYGLQAAAYRLGIPFTGHPMIGHDIIYIHPANSCIAIGQAAERDFLAFAHNVSNLDGGVYISLGSAVMSPMIFEKSLSMSQNLAIQNGRHIDNHYMVIADLQECTWDWSQGEPPETDPAYYLRFMKTFARMGGTAHYMTADNRDFLLALWQGLQKV
ncbi:MAG: hypothetical protein WC527_05640 [Candidatus Margulisiibacteriota bacterium]